ncbi:putative efflux protein MATE family [Firmicutes bacterium CAG:170]|nr:putative efflux protein MATE family [Firmicutes bacterium CAG:170]
MYRDLTKGNITKGLVLFALPMIAGNLLQQLYNIADTLIVGRALGRNALAAVGSAYTLMTFLTSVFLGLSMGAGALFSICLGKQDKPSLRSAVAHALGLILGVTLLLNAAVYLFLDEILLFLQIPAELAADMRTYLLIIFAGLLATSVYNFFACLLRAVGNSVAPLWFLGISALLNIGLDLLFVLVFHWGIAGAAAATVFSQYVSGVGLLAYTFLRCREFLPSRAELRFRREILRELLDLSMLTCAQQSAMNFGILLIQRLVDSFGPITMAAFAAAVKIDTFAYLPVQDFGNAFSTFVAQNFGAGRTERLRRGFRQALLLSAGFSVVLSALVCIFAHPLMRIFVQAGETEVLAAGVRYLRVEGAFYAGIGCLFLLYGFYRAVKRPGMSVVLTVISLGTRVALAYALAGTLGEVGIWAAIPIGWALADLTGLGYYLLRRTKLLGGMEKAEI